MTPRPLLEFILDRLERGGSPVFRASEVPPNVCEWEWEDLLLGDRPILDDAGFAFEWATRAGLEVDLRSSWSRHDPLGAGVPRLPVSPSYDQSSPSRPPPYFRQFRLSPTWLAKRICLDNGLVPEGRKLTPRFIRLGAEDATPRTFLTCRGCKLLDELHHLEPTTARSGRILVPRRPLPSRDLDDILRARQLSIVSLIEGVRQGRGLRLDLTDVSHPTTEPSHFDLWTAGTHGEPYPRSAYDDLRARRSRYSLFVDGLALDGHWSRGGASDARLTAGQCRLIRHVVEHGPVSLGRLPNSLEVRDGRHMLARILERLGIESPSQAGFGRAGGLCRFAPGPELTYCLIFPHHC